MSRVIIDELEFEAPYGKISAKTWHEDTEDCRRILALHGWMDNAGSFDNIAPKLKDKNGVYVVAIDLPGHGKSSQLPPGSSYNDVHMVMEIRRVLLELNWVEPKIPTLLNGDTNMSMNPVRKFTIMGHSLGAGLGMFYSSLFPDDIDTIILFDFVKGASLSPKKLSERTSFAIDQFINTVASSSPATSPLVPKGGRPVINNSRVQEKGNVVVSQEAALVATIDAHSQLGKLSREDASCLLRRSTVAVSHPPNCVIYSRDLRLQSMLNFRDHSDTCKLMFGPSKSNVMCILGRQGIYCQEDFKTDMEIFIGLLEKNCKSFRLEWIDGDHYIHMNRSGDVLRIVNEYLASL